MLHEGGMEHEAGVGPGGLGSAFVVRLPRFLEFSGTRFRAVAGNTYVVAVLQVWKKHPCDVLHGD